MYLVKKEGSEYAKKERFERSGGREIYFILHRRSLKNVDFFFINIYKTIIIIIR